jgi:hypothetical protein
MARAVSTVLDVAVCLLLVGAAVATLTTAPPPNGPDSPDADPTAATVAAVTTSVQTGNGHEAHGSLAGHLGTAAVADARLDGEPLTGTDYPDAVDAEYDSITGERTFATARWEPYPGSPLAGDVAAGETPPPSADVAATTLTVDSGIDDPAPGSEASFADLADALAGAYVVWLFPPERTFAALADSRTAPRTAARYRTAAGALETDVAGAVDDGAVRRANAALADALAARFEADLRARYATPRAAEANETVGEVDVVVRRWEP